MRQRLSRLRSDDLVRDSFLMFAAGMLFNVFSYGYHFYVGRALGPADYAVVGSLISLIGILGVPMGTVQAVITNFVSRFNAKGELSKVSFLFPYFRRQGDTAFFDIVRFQRISRNLCGGSGIGNQFSAYA